MSRVLEGPVTAALGLGGNIGDVAAAMRAVLAMLDARNDTDVAAVSSLYRTPPWGLTDQPDFLNCAALVKTQLPADELLAACLDAEKALKRDRAGATRWGPRPIDIDVLTYDDQTIRTDALVVPHPRMTDRGFVLLPLGEIAPHIVVDGKTIGDWAAAIDATGIERIGEPDWWRS